MVDNDGSGDVIKIRWRKMAMYATSFTAVCGAMVIMWNAAAYLGIDPVIRKELDERLLPITEKLESHDVYLALQRWSVLNERLVQNGRLSPEDLFEYCKLSAQLGYKSPVCR